MFSLFAATWVIATVIQLPNAIGALIFGIRTLFAFVAWVAILCSCFVAAKQLPERLSFLPASVAWNLFTLFVLFATLSAVLTTRNRGFWAGVSVFGAAPVIAGILPMNSMIQYPSVGRIALELLGLGLNPDVSGDDTFTMYMIATVPIADLSIATLTALFGGFSGERIVEMGRQADAG